MSSQGMIIKELREKKGMTQSELGKAIGTTKQNIFKYESGAVDTIPNKKLQALAKALDVDPWDILGWDIPGTSGIKSDYISIPLISQKISAGYGEDFLDDDSITMKRIQIPESLTKGVADKSTLVSAEVKGDSMIDANIFPGDYVFFSKGLIKGEGIYVIAFAGDIMVKRLAFDAPKNKLSIISENKNYPVRIIDAESDGVRILGKVIGWIHNEMV